MLRINAKYFTAYHSETDRQTECPNAIMKHYLQAFVNYMQDNWAKWIPGAEFIANNVPLAITLASPFLANSGQNPHLRFKPCMNSVSIDPAILVLITLSEMKSD